MLELLWSGLDFSQSVSQSDLFSFLTFVAQEPAVLKHARLFTRDLAIGDIAVDALKRYILLLLLLLLLLWWWWLLLNDPSLARLFIVDTDCSGTNRPLVSAQVQIGG